MKINEKFLVDYLNSNGPVGFEYDLNGVENTTQKLWMKQMSKYSNNVKLDNYGTAFAEIGNPNSDYKVIIDAHADEVSWLVNYIDKDGYIKVIKNGGSDPTIAASKRVTVWGDKGPVDGFFGQPAIHIKDRKTDNSINSLFVDIGADSKEDVINMGIEVGTVITFKEDFMKLGNGYYTGKALDNRIGGFMISEVARMIKENNIELPYKLYVVNSVQEEVGLKGARMIADRLKPDVAIVTDVTHDTTAPGYDKKKQGEIKCKEGPVIKRAPSVQNNLRKMIIDRAKKEGLKYQLAASSPGSGTNTDSFAISNGGVPSALISLPLKYMHTTCETVHKSDVERVINLIYNTLINLDEGHDFRYNK